MYFYILFLLFNLTVAYIFIYALIIINSTVYIVNIIAPAHVSEKGGIGMLINSNMKITKGSESKNYELKGSELSEVKRNGNLRNYKKEPGTLKEEIANEYYEYATETSTSTNNGYDSSTCGIRRVPPKFFKRENMKEIYCFPFKKLYHTL